MISAQGVLVLVLALTALPAQESAPRASTELELRVECAATALELGKGVELVVTCVWGKDLIPEPLDTSVWRPFVLTEVGDELREDVLRFVRKLSFRCHVFTREVPTLPPLVLRARPREGGETLVATAKAPAFVVRPAAESRPSGPPEPPFEFFEAPPARPTVLLFALFALLLFGACTWQARRAGIWPFVRRAATSDPRAIAVRRLEGLAAETPRTRAELNAWYLAATDAVRGWLEAGPGIGAPHHTSEEILAAVARSPRAALRDRLEPFLAHCDLVKFARAETTTAEREAMLAAARAIVDA